MKRLRGVGRIVDKHAEMLAALLALVLLIGVIIVWVKSSHDFTAIHSYGLLIAAIFAFPLGFWRSRVAERQASAAQEQVRATQQQLRTSQRQADAAQAQVETAKQSLLNERYQRGAEMLGSKVLAVRLGGIYALQRLAKDQPKEYHVQIIRLLCAFVRVPTLDGTEDPNSDRLGTEEVLESHNAEIGLRPRQDVEAAMEAIASRSNEGIGLERDAEFRLDLRGAQLGGLNLMNIKEVNLSWANLSSADLSQLNLRPHTDMSWIHAVNANFSDACLIDVNLSVVRFWGTDLSRTLLSGANLSGAVFSNNKDTRCILTQAQLDSAFAHSSHPPLIDGVLDVDTGEPLIWKDRPLRNRI